MISLVIYNYEIQAIFTIFQKQNNLLEKKITIKIKQICNKYQ